MATATSFPTGTKVTVHPTPDNDQMFSGEATVCQTWPLRREDITTVLVETDNGKRFTASPDLVEVL